MSPARLIEDVLSTVRKYTPILVVHVLLLLFLGARVLDPAALRDGTTIWAAMAAHINSALMALGLSLQLWYVLAALVLAYMAAFDGVKVLVTGLPILRIKRRLRYEPWLLGEAVETLRMTPNIYKASDELDTLVDKHTRELRETNRLYEYQWLDDREHTYRSYYGTVLVILGGAVAWAIEGGTMARSSNHVWQLVFLLGLSAIVVRWRTVRVIAENGNHLGYWALRELKQHITDDYEDPLGRDRRKLIYKQAEFQAAAKRHPVTILQSLAHRLPERFTQNIRLRLTPSLWRSIEDWDVLASRSMRYQDEKHAPPEALRVDGLLKHFTGLLECPGSGLCMLAPRQLGLAPAVYGCGATYSFAERRHGGFGLEARLIYNSDPVRYELEVFSYDDKRAFLAEIGYHPIELVAQCDIPDFPTDGRDWHALVKEEFDEGNWPSHADQSDKVVGDITLAPYLPMQPGSTYLARWKLSSGTQAVVAFQCFQVGGSDKILIAWRILDVFVPEEEAPGVAAWWKLKSPGFHRDF